MKNSNAILIVGAGPVGMTLAIRFAMQGIPITIIDKREGITDLLRAVAVSKSTEEIFNKIGVLEKLKQKALSINDVKLYHKNYGCVDFCYNDVFDLSGGATHVYQPTVEKVLEQRLNDLRTPIEWKCKLINISSNGDEVTVTLQKNADEREVRSYDFVCACDGATSTVRKLLDFKIEEKIYGYSFYLTDVMLDNEQKIESTHWYIDSEGYVVIIPGPGHKARIIFSHLNAHKCNLDKNYLDNLLKDRTTSVLNIDKILWTANAQFMYRSILDNSYKQIVLLGDAYHIFSPIGGVNMNFGVQDADYLADLIGKSQCAHQNYPFDVIVEKYYSARDCKIKELEKFTHFVTRLMTRPEKYKRMWAWLFDKIRSDTEFKRNLIMRFSGIR